MKILRPLTAILLALTMLTLCACKDRPDSGGSSSDGVTVQPEASAQQIQLLYCSNDTLDPYETINKLNAEIGKLLFDSLTVCSNEFEAVNILAQSVTVEGNICTVKLRQANFSDKTPVTSDDVLSSYSLAKKSSLYSNLFYGVKNVYAKDSSTVVFELSRNDPYFANMLTFPIIKKGTDDLKNEDNVEIVPTGSGRYVFSAEENALLANPEHYSKAEYIPRITLIDAPDTESVEHYVEIGAADLYYTDPVNGNIIRMSGQKISLNMNDLVYIGINHNYAPLSDPQLRYAISSAVDRTAICDTAFYKNAVAANGFFHPDWAVTSGYQTLQTGAVTKIAIENLEQIGYNNLDSAGYRKNSSGNTLALTLLVNRNNASRVAAAEQIKTQLASVGIKLTVNAVSAENYFSALESGSFQLYLGEARLTPNMDIGELVLPGGKAAYGIISYADEGTSSEVTSSEDTAEVEEPVVRENYEAVLRSYYAGETEISNVATALLTDMPVIPVAYRSSLLFYSANISSVGRASVSDIFLSVDKFKN